MYHRQRAAARTLPHFVVLCGVLGLACGGAARAQDTIVKRLESPNDRVELMVNSSRILTLDQNIPRVQVNNPDILAVTPLSKDQVQISAKKPGVTEVNLWGENGKIYSVNVVVYGDVQELQLALNHQYPNSSVKVHRYSNSLVLSGYVDRPDYVSSIVRLAEDYAPKIINNITVGGVQQILLNVQVMEVSRTKLRSLGFDFAQISPDGFVTTSISGLITAMGTQTGSVTGAAGDTVRFGIIDNGGFFGFLKALRQNELMKVLAEPKLTTVSGRPASFQSGGEFPILVPQSLGTVSIEFKKFGTQVDFMPLVLGNGNIRLEVRPRVSEVDNTRSVKIGDYTIPGLRVREVDTAVEMKAGQTLALAGLVQMREEAQNRGIPYLADIPVAGAAFRSVTSVYNEIELLILVRPEFVDAMDPHEVPHGGPSLNSCTPNDCDLYWKGYLEVPCHDGACENCEMPAGDAIPVPQGQVAPNGEPVPAPAADAPQLSPPNGSAQHYRNPNGAVSGPAGAMTRDTRDVAMRPNAPQLAPRPGAPGLRTTAQPQGPPPGLIGPVGYDVLK